MDISSTSSKEQATYNEDEYIVGSGEMVDRFILLTSPAMSCLELVINKDEVYATVG